MKSRLHFIAAMVCAVILSACGGVSNSTTPAVVLDPTTQPVGYSAVDLTVGTGTDVVAAGDLVTMNYTLWLYKSTATDFKGAQIESSTSPLVFTVGTNNVITGFDQGVVGMKVGGSRRLVLPSNLAYGAKIIYAADGTTVLIPANSGLVYDVTLVTLAKKSS